MAQVSSPIVVLGAPRSGTSLVARLLAAHPGTVAALEPRLVWRFGNDSRSDQLRPEHATPAVVAHIHRHFSRVVAQSGGGRLVEKTPANALRPHFVDAVFPDALYVHVTRDGWAAVPSLRDLWERRSTGFDRRQVSKLSRRLREASPAQVRHYAAELAGRVRRGRAGTKAPPLYGPRVAGLAEIAAELGVLEAAAVQWRACVDATVAFGAEVGPRRFLQVALEELDDEALATMVEHCRLPADPAVGEHFRATFDPLVARRRAPLDPDERRIVAPYVAAANARLGYGGT